MVQDVAPLVSPTYQIQSHAEFLSRTTASGIPTDLPAALDQLSHAAFGQYNGAIVGTPAFKRWFTSRPGMTDASRFVATIEGQVVSSLFVTVTPMQWNGEIVTAGLIDSVMTHPDHRRQGLATALLTRAVDFLSDQGGDLALLYTVAYSVPYRLYVSLGFADYLRVHLLQRPSGEGGTHPFDAARHKPAELRNFLDRAFS
ncbi:MAG: GNAT family N-acetyltransferase, partial [Candidatus Latescibacteria bacterium]|nr:GNAT family N-acetyltransferase [Candidatus Latescibacterota bacterium]